MLKRLTEFLYAASSLCQTLQHCPAGARYLVLVVGIGAIAYLAQLAFQRA